MEKNIDTKFDLYSDIKNRTNGEVYVGVVGPVRTGKSTFIKRFMDLLVLPNIINEADKIRANDELPQSSAGRTIMTTEPKFIPKEAVNIDLDQINFKIRLIDCVGFLVNGAAGHMEDEKERMVKTPWSDEAIPFSKAAEIGTNKVIKEHSTVGIVITGDGSFGDFERKDYLEPEQKTIEELKLIGKPFVVILNTTNPLNSKTISMANSMKEQYNCNVIPVDCQNLTKKDVDFIFKSLLNEFPMKEIVFDVPSWIEMISDEEYLRQELISVSRKILGMVKTLNDAGNLNFEGESECFSNIHTSNLDTSAGKMTIDIKIDDKYYFDMLSKLSGQKIENEYELITMLKELTEKKSEFDSVGDAISNVELNGYSVVFPTRDKINIEKPVVIKNGNKFGVKINAQANTIYMIQTSIITEMAPIVGSEQQANDLIQYISDNSGGNNEELWDINIFGKTIEQIVNDGINDKIRNITDDNMTKVRDTLQKVMNENSGIVCLIV